MNGMDLLEEMEFVNSEFIEEAKELPKRRRRIKISHLVGLAACISLILVSGGMLMFLPEGVSEQVAGAESTEIASVFGQSGVQQGIIMIVLFASIAMLAGFIAVIIIDRKRREGKGESA